MRQEQFDLRGEVKESLTQFQKEAEGRVAAFEEFYETKVSLQGPVSYWKNKQNGILSEQFCRGLCS